MEETSVPLNEERYAELLKAALPVVIETEEEHERLLTFAENLMEKGEQISPEEEKVLALLVFLIEVFESSQTEAGQDDDEDEDEPEEPATPPEILRRLMQARGVSLEDVSDAFGSPGAAREFLDGKRPASRGQAKALGQYFQVPPKLFQA